MNSIFGRRNKGRDLGLTGLLKDFGLTDLFQLLGQQQKTGVLELREDKKVVQVLFDRGMIVGPAFPSETPEESPLGNILIRKGLLAPEKWKKAYDQHKEELISIERVLVKSGTVRNEDLAAFLKLLTFETVYSLFKWKGGSFRFETKQVFYDANFIEPLNAEYVLLDVLRMVDEWPVLAERLPTFEVVLQKVNAMATLDVLAGTPWEKKRTFQTEAIYGLVDGRRTVKEIIDLSFLGEFDTCKNLIFLMDAGLIEPTAISVGGKKRRGIQVNKHLLDAGAYLLVSVLVLFLIFQLAANRWESFPLSQGERKGWLTSQEPLRKIEGLKAKNAREVFFLEENRYPADPSEMVKRGLLPR